MYAQKVLIIAEAGVNHNGSIETALQLVEEAAKAGVDAVKFQTFKADGLVQKSAPKAEYQKAATGGGETQYEMLKRLELSDNDHRRLVDRCRSLGIMFLSTAFDINGIRYLNELDLPYMKVPSGEITNLPYLRAMDGCGRPVLMSTGMATLDEVRSALAILKHCNVTLLQCATEYPCPYDAVNLNAMLTLKKSFGLNVGYSDHTPGIEISIAAVALGACVIEKHFTLDRNMSGPDHKASIEPKELRQMVSAIRNVEVSLGDGIKRPADVELKNIPIARKSIVAKIPIRKGETLTEVNLTVKRPGTGISPMRWDEIVGTAAIRDYAADELI